MRVALLCAVLCLTRSSFASPVQLEKFAGEGTGKIFVSWGGTYGDTGTNNADTAELGLSLTLDPDALQLEYNHFKFSSNGFDLSFSKLFNVGLGRNVTITTDIHVDPFTIIADPLRLDVPLSLVSVPQPGRFLLAGGPVFAFPNFFLTGDYTLAGPTETQSGTFSLLFTISSDRGLRNFVLDSNNYPMSIRLLNDGPQAVLHNGLFGTDFGGTVDGVNIAFDFRAVGLNADPVTLANVPEPASVTMLLLGGLLLFYRYGW